MAAVALLKFTQGTNVGIGGWAFVVTDPAAGSVSIENDDNTDVDSWSVELVYAAPGSALVPGVLASGVGGSPPAASFSPDVPGPYRVVLRVFDTSMVENVDIRDIIVPLPYRGFLVAPFQRLPQQLPLLGSGEPGEKPDEMNVGGQPYGWAGDDDSSRPMMFQAMQILDSLVGLPDQSTALPGDTVVLGDDLPNEPIVVRPSPGSAWVVQSNVGGTGLPLLTRYSTITDEALETVELTAIATDVVVDAVFDGSALWVLIEDTSSGDMILRPVLPRNPRTTPGSVVDPASTVTSGDDAVGIAFDGTHLWLVDNVDLTRVDPATPGGPYTTVSLGSTDINAVLFDPNPHGPRGVRVWVADVAAPSLERVELGTPAVDGTLVMSDPPVGLAAGGAYIWTTAVVAGVTTLFRVWPDFLATGPAIDTSSTAIDAVIPGGGAGPFSVAYDDVNGKVWVLGEDGSGDPVAVRLDPSTLAVDTSVVLNTLGAPTTGPPHPAISFFDGSVWATSMGDGTSYRIEPVGAVATALDNLVFPTFRPLPQSSLENLPVDVATASFIPEPEDRMLLVKTTTIAATCTISLVALSNPGTVVVKDDEDDATTYNIDVVPPAGHNIDGVASPTPTSITVDNDVLRLYWGGGTDWRTV